MSMELPVFHLSKPDASDRVYMTVSHIGLETAANAMWINFLGSERLCLHVKTMISDTESMYQKQVMCFKWEHQFTVTVESMNRDITEELLAVFQKVN